MYQHTAVTTPSGRSTTTSRGRWRAGLLIGALTLATVVGMQGAASADTTSGRVDAGGTAAKVVSIQVAGPGTISLSLDWSTTSANLNLFLKSPSGVQVAKAISKTARPETIAVAVTQPGTYKITVKAVTGGSDYTLTADYPAAVDTTPSWLETVGGPGHAEMYPSGLDVDPLGTMYIADTGNDQVAAYRSDGTQLWRVGPRSSTMKALGRFSNPRDVAYLNGRLYVADLANNRVQVLDASSGQALSQWSYRFTSIIGISAGVDGAGNPVILATDDAQQAVLRFRPDGTGMVKIGSGAKTGSAACPTVPCANPAIYNAPRDAATDGAGNVYVADYTNDRMQKFTAGGNFVLAWGTKGAADGQFARPYGVDVDDSGKVYVADSNNARVQVFTPAGEHLITMGGEGGAAALSAGLRRVAVGSGIAPDVYGSDLWGSHATRFAADGSFERLYGGPDAPVGFFNEPGGVAVDDSSVFVMDTNNQRVQRFGADHEFETTWGERGFGETNSGFNWARDVTIAGATNTVWVADTKNNRLQEFDRTGAPTGRTMGRMGYAPGPGVMYWPHAVAASGQNVVVANTKLNRVELWDPELPFTNATGRPSKGAQLWTSTGTAGLDFANPKDVTVKDGVVYVADADNHRIVMLRLSDGSVIGEMGGATLHRVEGVAVAPNGTIWASDTSWNRLVQFSPSGTVLRTYGGGSGVSSAPAHGKFNAPTHLEIHSTAGMTKLYVVDSYNDRIEVIDITGSSS